MGGFIFRVPCLSYNLSYNCLGGRTKVCAVSSDGGCSFGWLGVPLRGPFSPCRSVSWLNATFILEINCFRVKMCFSSTVYSQGECWEHACCSVRAKRAHNDCCGGDLTWITSEFLKSRFNYWSIIFFISASSPQPNMQRPTRQSSSGGCFVLVGVVALIVTGLYVVKPGLKGMIGLFLDPCGQ